MKAPASKNEVPRSQESRRKLLKGLGAAALVAGGLVVGAEAISSIDISL